MSEPLDLTACRFGNIIVLELADKTTEGKNGNVYWKVYDLKRSAIRVMRSDNLRRDPTYRAWDNMIQRCRAVAPHYKLYYGQIHIEDLEWFNYQTFLEDMGPKPKGLTLERLDNTRGYCKENCAWRSYKEQAANRRPQGSVKKELDKSEVVVIV